jgi:hypothetical protein
VGVTPGVVGVTPGVVGVTPGVVGVTPRVVGVTPRVVGVRDGSMAMDPAKLTGRATSRPNISSFEGFRATTLRHATCTYMV